jgi:hypothetical protein
MSSIIILKNIVDFIKLFYMIFNIHQIVFEL